MRARIMADENANARLETFCDGVFAIALTLLIIDVRLPSTDRIGTTADLWRALRHLTPIVFALVLSFGVIFITWVNHHVALGLVHRSSASFIYANGALLLTVVFIPFPTSLMGEFLLTDAAAPAVVLYDAVLAVQAIGWVLLGGAALRGRLTRSEVAAAAMHANRRHGYFACFLYSAFALAAFWIPRTVAVVTMGTWIFWLVLSIRMKRA